MGRKKYIYTIFLAVFILPLICSGCASDKGSDRPLSGEKRESVVQVLTSSATGNTVYGNEIVSIDASNTTEGYIMVQYSGAAPKAKMQITTPDAVVYTYTLGVGSYETFPLTGGNGAYHIDILESVQDNLYALVFSQDLDISIGDEFKPYLYPNQYVWFTQDAEAVKLAVQLSDESYDDLDFVKNVYNYVIDNIVYDEEAAQNIQTDYIPNIDVTLSSKKGICFDYASLMASMLRSQSIPTRLEVGYSGQAYHAWISVYIKETGWIDDVIKFDGKDWSLMDPTLGANNSSSSVGKFIGDGSNYIVKYSY